MLAPKRSLLKGPGNKPLDLSQNGCLGEKNDRKKYGSEERNKGNMEAWKLGENKAEEKVSEVLEFGSSPTR